MNEKNKTALTKGDVEQFSRKIIWKRMGETEFELFKKGYSLGHHFDMDPEVRRIEQRISRRVGETVYLSRSDIEVLHKAKGHRKSERTSLAKVPEKYHLIKPVTVMFEKAVKALPVNRKRLTKENIAAMDDAREVIRHNGSGFICFHENTQTGERSWGRLKADDPIFKAMDVLRGQPAHMDGLSDDLIWCVEKFGRECLNILEHATVTRRFLGILPDRAGQETHEQWEKALAGADFSVYKALTNIEKLEQAMHRQRKRSLRGVARVEALSNIFGDSLVFHWAAAVRWRQVNGATKRGFSVPYLTFSMDRKEMALLLHGGEEVLGETSSHGKVHCILRADYMLSGSKESALDPPLSNGIRAAFFQKLVKHEITPDKFRQMIGEAICYSLDEQMSKTLQKEKERSGMENDMTNSLVDSSLSSLGKDFPDETQDWLSNAPRGV